jgi:hypothetical protein
MSDLRVLIINTDYPEFLEWFYATSPGLAEAPYADQLRARADSLFGIADFYSRNFKAIGWDAIDVHANNEIIQRRWAFEHGVHAEPAMPEMVIQAAEWMRRIAAQTPLRHLKPMVRPALAVLDRPNDWLWDVLAAQFQEYQPDVILNTSLAGVSGRFLRDARSNHALIVGQIASPLPADASLREYDLVVSSLPNFVEYFRRAGVPSELSRFAFEPSILSRLQPSTRTIDVSFVGSLSPAHPERLALLKELAERRQIQMWGPLVEHLSGAIAARYRGPAWGLSMYQILADSRITLNCHIGIAGSYANNMRLFEATGAGTLLVTDWKKNLDEMFAPGVEVVTYRTADECAELVAHYLENEADRREIAKRGQERTLRDHTYHQRVEELVEIFERHL